MIFLASFLAALLSLAYLAATSLNVGPYFLLSIWWHARQLLRVSYARYKLDVLGDPTSKKLAVGYVHNLSKRTALFATVAHVGNRGTVASNAGTINASIALNGAVTGAGGSSSGYDLGIRHSFLYEIAYLGEIPEACVN